MQDTALSEAKRSIDIIFSIPRKEAVDKEDEEGQGRRRRVEKVKRLRTVAKEILKRARERGREGGRGRGEEEEEM